MFSFNPVSAEAARAQEMPSVGTGDGGIPRDDGGVEGGWTDHQATLFRFPFRPAGHVVAVVVVVASICTYVCACVI